MGKVVLLGSFPLNITVVLCTVYYVFCCERVEGALGWFVFGPTWDWEERRVMELQILQIQLAVKECVGKNDRGWWRWSLVSLRCEACCWDEDADMELGEAGKEAKGETTAIMVSIIHLIFKIFNLFVCLFVCPLVFMSLVWITDQYLNQFHWYCQLLTAEGYSISVSF